MDKEDVVYIYIYMLLSRFSRVRLCATPQTASYQAPPSMGFSRQEHWSGLPVPSPIHASEKWKWSHSVVSDSWRPHGLQPSRLLRPWDSPGKSTRGNCHSLLYRFFPTQGSNLGLLHCRQILCCPSYQGSHIHTTMYKILPRTYCTAQGTVLKSL